MRYTQPGIPAAPLLRMLEQPKYFRWHDGQRYPPTIQRAIDRGRATGRFTVWAADKLAIEILGMHPSLVYGDGWWGCGQTDPSSTSKSQVALSAIHETIAS